MVWEGVKDKEWSGLGTMFTPHMYIDQMYVTLCSFGGSILHEQILRMCTKNGHYHF